MAGNTAELQSFGRACAEEINEVTTLVFHYDSHNCDHDDDLLLFYYSNPELSVIYKMINSKEKEHHKEKRSLQGT